MTTPTLSVKAALAVVNSHLCIDAVRTLRGDEVKCWTHDEDNGTRSKNYLDSKGCFELAEAFEALGVALGAPESNTEEQGR